MCEECEREAERRSEAIQRELTDPAMVAMSERYQRHAGAVVGDDQAMAADVDPAHARGAAALTAGVPAADMEKLVASLAYVAMTGVQRGLDVFSCLESSALQGFVMGWLVRDEQIKAGADVAASESAVVDPSPGDGAGASMLQEAIGLMNARTVAVAPGAQVGQQEILARDQMRRALAGTGLDLDEIERNVTFDGALTIARELEVADGPDMIDAVARIAGALLQMLVLGVLHERVRVERERV